MSALAFVVAIAACTSHAFVMADFCIPISSGPTTGYPITLAKTVLAAGPTDWQIQIPDLTYCPTVVGVTAQICDGDAQPEAHFVSLKLIHIHRVYGFTPAYIQPTVYCQSVGSSKLSNLGSYSSLSPNSVLQLPSPLKAYSQTYSSLTFPQSLLGNSLSLSSLSDSSKSLLSQSVADQRLHASANAAPLSSGLNRLSKLNISPYYGNSDQSVLDQQLHLSSLLGQSPQSSLSLSGLPKLIVTPLLGSSQSVYGQSSPQLSLSSLSPSSLVAQLGPSSGLDGSGSVLPRATASPLLNLSQKPLSSSLYAY
ncbi:uncharacterized protein LOC118279048 [Spodoptera frugiperda]|uniref:Uncharacterized protein LOC118279048 n=1 Tax=Spodoptera frugiperda TaxID=7108 RepID=A0A9R0ERW9_SPOFR|nr:uncharacterized protein LOC118279048 [Spodoptera frugiperda]